MGLFFARFKMKESDWKIFKKIKAQALELYCENALNEFKQIIDQTDKTHHDRYGQMYDSIHKQDKRLAALFDNQSRSQAGLQLMFMRRENIVNPALILKLSQDFQDQTKPSNFD